MQMVIYTRLIQSIRVLSECDYTSLLVDCYSISATTSIFPERFGDPSICLLYHDRTLMV